MDVFVVVFVFQGANLTHKEIFNVKSQLHADNHRFFKI